MKRLVKKITKKTSGQGSIEYAILIALISVAAISSLVLFAGKSEDGECIELASGSNSLIGNYRYEKNGDTGLISIYKNITCVIGGWKDGNTSGEDQGDIIVGDDVLTVNDAKEAGFIFKRATFRPFYSHYRITGFDASKLVEGQTLIIPKIIIDEKKVPMQVKSIDVNAFKGVGLKSVEIPEHIQHIHLGAFSNNPNLEEVIIKGDNTYAHIGAFPRDLNLRGKLKPGIYTRKQ